ncbi:NADPH-dependent F420 reductase [Mesorhizobium japonicum]|uniref:NADPH-dependent F420 reductase n=1 Tax=Mesorhizobium japonicum TaxID=2066070 RepID=UPI003B5C40A8
MTDITIFGTGNMGAAIAGVLAAGGADIHHVNTSSGGGIQGDIVILATPYAALRDIVDRYGADLAGKIVVDITNPIDFQTFQMTVPADSSAAAQLASWLPASHVVKAFNTNFAQALVPSNAGTVVLIAGDDEGAKKTLADAVTAGGLSAIDAGPLSTARELEAVAYLQIKLAMAGKASGIAVIP